MDFENLTPFSALDYEIMGPEDEEYHVIVARGTFHLRDAAEATVTGSDGAAARITHVATPAGTQEECAVTDAYFGEINQSSVRSESDLAPYKPKCDVIVIGSAHSPTGAPVPRVDVRIRIRRLTALPRIADEGTPLDHRLVVHGPRAFVRRSARDGEADEAAPRAGWILTDPEPFEALPLRYEHAFGGEIKVYDGDEVARRIDGAHRLSEEARAKHPEGDAAPVAHAACIDNPLGVGYLEGWYADAASVDRWPAPQIEAPGALITAEIFDRMVRGEARAGELSELSPRGVGVVAKPWQQRLKLAGTLDERWLSERWPYMPPDFDMAYWNGAHPDMQCEYLYGGEIVELWNLLPAKAEGAAPAGDAPASCCFRLPEAAVNVGFEAKGGQLSRGAAPMDTIIIDLEKMCLSMVWRAVTPASMEMKSATLLMIR